MLYSIIHVFFPTICVVPTRCSICKNFIKFINSVNITIICYKFIM